MRINAENSPARGKIVATLGPASSSEDMLIKLREAGVDVFRLNFSHASKEASEMVELFLRIRRVAPDLAIMCDIQGPKIRIGELRQPVTLKKGDEFLLFENPIIGDSSRASISYTGFLNDLGIGDNIFINDGLIRLRVIGKDVSKGFVTTEVMAGGPLYSFKGVNIPAGELSIKTPTEKDVRDLNIIRKLAPEFVAVSFVENVTDIERVRAILDENGPSGIKIIAKIERPIALVNLDEIISGSDGIMVARGDLGVEIPAEEVPLRQKEIVKKCNLAAKPVIVATQMLESMVNSSVPTRAEVNDVFNAIYDRADAVMLSEETAMGEYPVEAVDYMNRIISKAERTIPSVNFKDILSAAPDMYEALGEAIGNISHIVAQHSSGKILMFTTTGKSPRVVAKFRPLFPVIAVSDNLSISRQLKLSWGIIPLYIPTLKMESSNAEQIIQHGIRKLVEMDLFNINDVIVCAVSSKISRGMAPLIGIYEAAQVL